MVVPMVYTIALIDSGDKRALVYKSNTKSCYK
jgi:hypothetical protein